MIIYKATNKINGKCYIGRTSESLAARKAKHIFSSKHHDFVFYKAIRKYGKENFKWEILEKCSVEKSGEREIYFIKLFESFYGKKKGYNMTPGGKGFCGKHSKESLKKMSEAHKGFKHTKESKQKISKAFKGEKHPQYGKKGKQAPMWGKKQTEETKNKIRKKLIGNTGRVKEWTFKYKGKMTTIKNLVKWSKENNISMQKAKYHINKYGTINL